MTRNREDIANELVRLEARLASLDAERAALREQITAARRQLAAVEAVTISVPKLQPSTTPTPTTHPAKVALFASLFRGREDVYPRFWTNEKKGTKGWAPACSNEWKRPLCQKPKVKCGECPHQAFGPVTPQVIQEHLQGHHVIGVYPLMRSERCHLLAIDFDKAPGPMTSARLARPAALLAFPPPWSAPAPATAPTPGSSSTRRSLLSWRAGWAAICSPRRCHVDPS